MNEFLRHLLSSVSNPLFRSRPAQFLTSKAAVSRADHELLADRMLRFSEPETIQFNPPVSIDPLPKALEDKVGTIHIGRPFVSEFRDVTIVGPHALTLTRDGPLLENTLGAPRQLALVLARSIVAGAYPPRGEPTDSVDVAVALVGPWMNEYYHWFSDYLLRVEGLRRFEEARQIEPTVIVPQNPPAWMRQSLRFVGIEESRWLEWSGGSLHVEQLVVPSLRRETHLTGDRTGNLFSPRAYRWLANRIQNSVGAERTDGEARIFISRERAGSRRIINQKAVMEELHDRGFEKYVLEELSLEEQVELFTNAECILGPNGAGFVNMMYATDATVVPLYGPYVNACYPVMASGLGFECGYLLCQTEGLDMRVNVSKLSCLLDRL